MTISRSSKAPTKMWVTMLKLQLAISSTSTPLFGFMASAIQALALSMFSLTPRCKLCPLLAKSSYQQPLPREWLPTVATWWHPGLISLASRGGKATLWKISGTMWTKPRFLNLWGSSTKCWKKKLLCWVPRTRSSWVGSLKDALFLWQAFYCLSRVDSAALLV